MKTRAKETERVEIESDKTVLASAEKTLGEKTEKVGTTTPVKKKVRVVKKIVKKKVIKKVPKRVSVTPNCNDLENVASPNTNDNAPMEIEKPNVDDDDLREAENLKEFEVNDREKGVRLVETNNSCRDECEGSGLLTGSLLGDQNKTEMYDREHDINTMDIEEHEGEVGVKEQAEKSSEMDDGVSKGTEEDESEKKEAETSECVPVKIEVGLSKGEDGMKEQVEKRKHIDLKPSDIVEDQEGVKEVFENSETDSLRAEQGVSERRVLSGQMVASGWHMKQRTKIFIHGLDKETKEEDIRKVFEEVGEVVEVKIITNLKTGKSRGFGFIRYASEGHAKLALMKYHNVEICGRPCRTAAVEGSGTILLNNIDKKWKSEYVLALLQKIGIEKIDEVSVVADPENTELNRGFAFLELQTKRDAQIAYSKLQNKNVFGKHSKIKVEWAELLADPVEEEMHHIKSVYAEHIPSSWDEEEVKDHFRIFGEIESIALSKNLRSTKRSDFAFINYKTCEAALSCIETFTSKQSTNDDGSKAGVKVSLAKSIPKGKPIKTISESAANEPSKVKQKANQSRSVYKPHKPINTRVSSISRHEDAGKGGGSSTTAELVRLLREQASWKHGGPSPTTGMSTVHRQPPSGGKEPFIELGRESLYHHDPRTYHQTRLEIPSAAHPRSIANSVAMTSFPRYDQQRVNHAPGSFVRVEANPRYFQIYRTRRLLRKRHLRRLSYSSGNRILMHECETDDFTGLTKTNLFSSWKLHFQPFVNCRKAFSRQFVQCYAYKS
ncbi:nucleolin-like isoform X1 [Cynara cardunculus var. scolymus]|uniref:nucleolin-like isoform X1 n=1 Tax=Cynara cardunculus var. scolymus TaxID=59895 RepID=UPI000D626594|nr:nucleolin-like isoform X1 [Cynara cardunculus var. scolymus]